MKPSRIPTIIGVIILIIGLAAGVFLVQYRQIFKLGATGDTAPKNVKISNISDTSLAVSWVTDTKTEGVVFWGTSQGSLSRNENDELTGTNITHRVTINGLSAGQTIFLKINSSGTVYDDSGSPWQTSTGPSLAASTQADTISGTVLGADGNPMQNALVYVTVSGGSLLSTFTSQNGNWVVPISAARTADLANYIAIDDTKTLVEISVDAGLGNTSSAQIYPQSAKPAPAMTIGKTHDFTSLPPSNSSEIPSANVGLPNQATPSSGFNVPSQIATPSAQTVTLKSVSSGEIVTSTKPEFFGEGPPRTKLTITVQSEAVTGTAIVDSGGKWVWNPPSNLPAGSHTITISWTDASGILRTLTRTFVVQAAEGPAFVSTPSASTTPSPTPTPTPTPIITPTPTSTVSATPTLAPTTTPISTASGIPQTGSLTPTLLLSMMGIGFLGLSFLIFKYAR